MGLFDSFIFTSESSDVSEAWNTFSEVEEIETILDKSNECPQIIYKHSHRCGVCATAKKQIEDSIEEINELADLNFVDVVSQREISNHIASQLNIRHESPQVIIINNENVLWEGSHWEINGENILNGLTSDPVSS